MLEDELIVKIIGKLSLEYPDMDQLRVRELLYECVNNYEITARETALVASDIPERAVMYLAIKKLDGLSKTTLYNYKLHLERFSSMVVKPLSMITTNDIRLYLAMLSKVNNLKQTSIATEISVLKSFFSWLANEEIIVKNPMVKIKSPKKEKRLRKSLTQEELELLRDACESERERAILEFLFSTGCRLAELVGVDIKDIDWNSSSLKVIGKGNKERVVYLNPKSRIYIDKYLKTRDELDKLTSPALFICSKRPYNRLGRRSVEREVNIIAERAGFNKSVFPHLLRHTMATLGLKSGMSLTTVQKILGHEDPGTTEIYAEIDNGTIQNEFNKFLNQ